MKLLKLLVLLSPVLLFCGRGDRLAPSLERDGQTIAGPFLRLFDNVSPSSPSGYAALAKYFDGHTHTADSDVVMVDGK